MSGQLDEVVVGDSMVPGQHDQDQDQDPSACRVSLDCLQGYFTPEILNWIHFQCFSEKDQRPDVVLPVGNEFGTMTLSTLTQN